MELVIVVEVMGGREWGVGGVMAVVAVTEIVVVPVNYHESRLPKSSAVNKYFRSNSKISHAKR